MRGRKGSRKKRKKWRRETGREEKKRREGCVLAFGGWTPLGGERRKGEDLPLFEMKCVDGVDANAAGFF